MLLVPAVCPWSCSSAAVQAAIRAGWGCWWLGLHSSRHRALCYNSINSRCPAACCSHSLIVVSGGELQPGAVAKRKRVQKLAWLLAAYQCCVACGSCLGMQTTCCVQSVLRAPCCSDPAVRVLSLRGSRVLLGNADVKVGLMDHPSAVTRLL